MKANPARRPSFSSPDTMSQVASDQDAITLELVAAVALAFTKSRSLIRRSSSVVCGPK